MHYDVTKLFEPDILAEGRFFQAHRMKNLAEPERALLLAVLSEAIDTFRRFAFSNSARGQRLFCQAKEWLWDNDSEYFFSCGNICEVMELDAVYLRRGLLQWLETHTGSALKPDTVCFAKIGRTRSRTVYRQRQSLMQRRRSRSKAGVCRDSGQQRAAFSNVNTPV